LYFLVPNWRWNTLFVSYIPLIISFIILVTYIEETPQFLVKKGIKEALKALNRIGRINNSV